MKKLLIILTLVLSLVSMSACGVISCEESGCSDEVYEDGYCKYHYSMHKVDDTAKGLFDSLFGN